MRVLHVYKDTFPPVPGGVERYLHDITTFLASKGHQATILTASRSMSLRTRRTSHGDVEIVEVPCLFRILSNPVCPCFASVLRKLHSEKRFDLLHFHHPLPTAALAWMQARLDVPHVITYHSDIIRQAALVPLIEPVLWPFLRKARTVIATSPVYAASSRFLKNLTNVEVVPLGVDTERFRPGVSTEKGDYFLFVGRFRRYKGISVLLEAWRSLPGVRLVMVGGGPLEGLARKASELPGACIEMRGDVDDDYLVDLYRGARALILPSTERSEAFGMVQLEAMACSTPVISTNLETGVPWVNRDGESGIVVEPGDAAALAAAVGHMLEDDARSRFSQGALSRVLKEFRLDGMLEKLERIYFDAIRG